MTDDAFLRFLGVAPNASEHDLLDLPRGPATDKQINDALGRQQQRVRSHPDGASPAAQRVLAALTVAAQRLRKLSAPVQPGIAPPSPVKPLDPRRPRRPQVPTHGTAAAPPQVRPIQLTSFDRRVLAILVSQGGWNARSRARLVSLASEVGLSIDGLMTVMTGLSSVARTSGHRIDVRQITGGQERMPAMFATPPVRYAPPDPVEVDAQRWRRLAWTSGVVCACLIMLFVTIQLLTPDRAIQTTPDPPPRELVSTPALDVDDAHPPRSGRAELLFVTASMPTFGGNARPDLATTSADGARDAIDYLNLVARKLSINDTPSDAVYRDFEVSITTLGHAWILLDPATRDAALDAIGAVFQQVGARPSASDRLLRALTPTDARGSEPLSIWLGAYQIHTLARIGTSDALPEPVVRDARTELRDILAFSKSAGQPTPDDAARIWLTRQLGTLVERTETDPRAFDRWELWLAAIDDVSVGPRYDRAIGKAIQTVMESDTDLGRLGPSLNVLGRLLSQIGLQDRPAVRQFVLELFENPDVKSRDLWVMTSLLAQHGGAGWFTRDLVPVEDADSRQRITVREALAMQWPTRETISAHLTDTPEIRVDEALRMRWLELADRASQLDSIGDDERRLALIVVTARLNAIASALARDFEAETMGWLTDVDLLITSLEKNQQLQPPSVASYGGTSSRSGNRSGQAIGRDGEWAQQYDAVRGRADEKLRLMRMLRTSAGSDLGPTDAAVFVREVYTGSPSEVRGEAQANLISIFGAGPNVGLEMVRQYRMRSMPRETARVIEQYVGQVLPDPRDPAWRAEARRELLRYVLSIRRSAYDTQQQRASAMVDWIAAVYAQHHEVVKGAIGITSLDGMPDDRASQLRLIWRAEAEQLIASDPTPASLAVLDRRDLTRRELVEGPMQLFVVEQLALLDLLAYTTTAERPRRRAQVLQLLESGARERAAAQHVLDQSRAIEMVMLRIWAVRFDPGVTTDAGDAA
ncbi:MAG: hypothetical protein AAF432_08420 [Planctomycetota bacterium]